MVPLRTRSKKSTQVWYSRTQFKGSFEGSTGFRMVYGKPGALRGFGFQGLGIRDLRV